MPRRLIFTGRSVAYTHAIVLIRDIPKAPVDSAPSPETQAIGIISYKQMGDITNQLTEYLQKRGYAAEAGHPAMGPALYPPLAIKAGLGNGGRHGLLITPGVRPAAADICDFYEHPEPACHGLQRARVDKRFLRHLRKLYPQVPGKSHIR